MSETMSPEAEEQIRYIASMDAPGPFSEKALGALRVALAEVDRLRAQQPKPLRTEYGARVTYTDTLTAEGPIADTLDEALEALAGFDAKGHANVVSRELVQREVTGWRGVGSKTAQQAEDGNRG
jgi:hypothetical protein